MSDSSAGGLVGIAVLGLIVAVIILIARVVIIAAVIEAAIAAGVLSNIVLRYIPNQLNWRKIDNQWIWLVITSLVLVPIGIGIKTVSGPHNLLTWVVVSLYLLWLAGYIWAWINPRFELGIADVLMASSLTLAVTKLMMWWTKTKLRLKLFVINLGF
jgi:hypothetical protein